MFRKDLNPLKASPQARTWRNGPHGRFANPPTLITKYIAAYEKKEVRGPIASWWGLLVAEEILDEYVTIINDWPVFEMNHRLPSALV